MNDGLRERLVCSFGSDGPRSWTDVTSNHTYMAPLGAWFLPHLLEGNLPKEVLPIFMHEATHHSCLRSPVGVALALLGQESLHRNQDVRDLALVQLRIDATLVVLRPWLEGLALFAEFDAFPGATNVLAPPTITALQLFESIQDNNESAQSQRDPFFDFFSSLSEVRQTHYMISRKCDLLSSPWHSGGGYFQGYLAMKNASRALKFRSRYFFEDHDFVLNYAIHHLFYDVELGRLLLLPADDRKAFDRIRERVLERTRQLLARENLPEAAARLEQSLERSATLDDPAGLASIAALDDNLEVVRAFADEVQERGEALPEDGRAALGRFGILHLLSVPVTLEVAPENRIAVLLDGDELLTVPATEAYSNSRVDPACLDFYFDTNSRRRGAFLTQGEILLSHLGSPELDPILASREQVLARVAAHHDDVASRLSLLPYESWQESVLLVFDQVSEQASIGAALTWMPLEQVSVFLDSVSGRGFRGFLTEEQVANLAVLTLLESFRALAGEVRFSESGQTVEDAFRNIDSTIRGKFGGSPLRWVTDEQDASQVRILSSV